MLILFDSNVPKGLRRLLKGHFVRTAHERGWATLNNGMLLETAERAGLDLFLTADQNFVYQQNLAHRLISLVVLGSEQWPQWSHTLIMSLRR